MLKVLLLSWLAVGWSGAAPPDVDGQEDAVAVDGVAATANGNAVDDDKLDKRNLDLDYETGYMIFIHV